MPTGYLGVSPQIAASSVGTYYNTTDNFWVTYQTIAAGATNLAAITFITTGVVQLPANSVVRVSRRQDRGCMRVQGCDVQVWGPGWLG